MSERMPVNPRAEYLNIVNRFPRARNWFTFHEQQLPDMVRDSDTRHRMENVIHYHLRSSHDIRPDVVLPTVQWIDDEPVVQQLTGGCFIVPVLEFPERLMPVFEHIAGKSVGGATHTMPIELASLGGLNTNQSMNSQLVLLPHRGRVFTIPYGERRRHELTHAVDPFIDEREEAGRMLMQEIIAVIGSFSDPDNRYSCITLNPPYIVPYLVEELQRRGIDNVSQEDFYQMVNLVNGVIYKSTHILPKIPNDQVTRRIMRCNSLEELVDSWPELFE